MSKYPNEIKSVTLLSPAGLMNAGPLPLIRNSSCLASVVRSLLLAPRSKQEQAWRNDFYSHEGVFLEREEDMMRGMRAMYDSNTNAFDAFFQSVLQFPLYGLEAEITAMAQNDHLSVLLLWGKGDIAVPLEPSFSRWTDMMTKGKCVFSSKQYDNAAHGFLLEHPIETKNDILTFLRNIL